MSGTIDFYKKDFNSTLFPLKSNLLIIENNETELSNYIYQKVLNDIYEGDNFLSQQKVYATKPQGHLRRTVKLDPVSEYYLYDIVYRNRSIFRGKVSDSRLSYGYKFLNGSIIPIHKAFNEYKSALSDSSKKYKHNLKFDIASYFNCIYHHDICNWFASKNGVNESDIIGLGKYFREINSGRSVDFLPQGLYPSKMIGNEFLKFIDLSGVLKSKKIVRFMDDFTLFDDNETTLKQDFYRIQHLLGQSGLNVNPSKTYYDANVGDIGSTLSKIGESLKEIICNFEEVEIGSSVELVEVETEIENELDSEQVKALIELLQNDSLEETEADQILGFLRYHSNSILEHLPTLLTRFPNLIKHIYFVCFGITDKNALANVIKDYLFSKSFFLEYQLFWIAAIVEDCLNDADVYGEIIIKLFELTSEFKIAKAKVLEIPENGFGLKELRAEYLKTGQSDWLSWASAVGSRKLKAAERNYTLDYFSKGSPLNFIIASCVKKM